MTHENIPSTTGATYLQPPLCFVKPNAANVSGLTRSLRNISFVVRQLAMFLFHSILYEPKSQLHALLPRFHCAFTYFGMSLYLMPTRSVIVFCSMPKHTIMSKGPKT